VLERPLENPHFVISSGGRNLLSRDLSIYFEEKVLLLLGDMAVIVLALLIAPTIKYGIFVFEPGYLWPEIFVILTVYLLSFYIADLYNFESSFLSAAYLFRFSSLTLPPRAS